MIALTCIVAVLTTVTVIDNRITRKRMDVLLWKLSMIEEKMK